MAVISIRIPDELRKRMKKVRIDWAAYVRNAIERKLKEASIRAASQRIDEIRTKTKPDVFNAAKSIREDRESR